MSKSNNYQVIRPIGKPLSEAEKKERILQFLSQRREHFSISILTHLCHNPFLSKKRLVEKSVAIADALMEKLYPIKEEEKPKEETPAEKEK